MIILDCYLDSNKPLLRKARQLPPNSSALARVWRRVAAGDLYSSQVVVATSLPSLGDLSGTASREQPVSDARRGDLGTTTGDKGPARECHVGHTLIPTPCPTAGPGCCYLTSAHSSTRDPQKAHMNPPTVVQQGPPASPPCFGL